MPSFICIQWQCLQDVFIHASPVLTLRVRAEHICLTLCMHLNITFYQPYISYREAAYSTTWKSTLALAVGIGRTIYTYQYNTMFLCARAWLIQCI